MTSQQKGFNITNGRGFCITLANGMSVSVQFGSMNYCQNYNLRDERLMLRQGVKYLDQHECDDAEIALWDKNGEWVTKKCWKEAFDVELYDDVVGRVSPNTVVAVLNWAEAQ